MEQLGPFAARKSEGSAMTMVDSGEASSTGPCAAPLVLPQSRSSQGTVGHANVKLLVHGFRGHPSVVPWWWCEHSSTSGRGRLSNGA